VLVHNRKDMPGLPLAAEGDGHPSNTKIGKLNTKGKGKAVEKADKRPAKAEVPRARVPAKTSPAAAKGAAKRTSKPARPVRVASAKRTGAANAAKRSGKAAKRGKK
jgi:hypothetical protein